MKTRIHRFCAFALISMLGLLAFAAAQADLQGQFGCPPQVRGKTGKTRKANGANKPAHYTYEVLYNFCSEANCTDGSQVTSDLIRDAEDNLYGVTGNGGTGSRGTVFELDVAGNYTLLYNFCSQPNCADGAGPNGVVMDAAGNIYGTTRGGGTHMGAGVVFELSPPAQSGSAWTETVLYNFCPADNCSDGSGPTGIILDAAGNLYGATGSGGAAGGGTVFELSPPSQPGGTWAETVLHAFCSLSACADGADPNSGLVQDAGGNLYGTTALGWVFEVSPPNQPGGAWTETVLYYSAQDSFPGPGVIMGFGGNLYGITGYGMGTVYELVPTTSVGYCVDLQWTETTIYNFCSLANCADGMFPVAGVITDTAGNLYGTTATGGLDASQNSLGAGTVYELAPCDPDDPWQPCWTETTIYSFCSDGGTNCTDGQHPNTGLLRDPVGNLYGTTSAGGSHGAGTVFTLAVPSFAMAGTSVSLDPGATTGNTSTITLYPRGGFTGSVELTAAITSKPAGAQDLPTLSFASNPVSISGSSAVEVALTITTTAPTSAALERSARPGIHWYAGGMTLAFGLMFGIGICIPTRGRIRRRRLGPLLFLVILFLAISPSGLLSCGGGTGVSSSGNSSPGTTPGAYVVTVTGTSGSITATGTVTLTVQ